MRPRNHSVLNSLAPQVKYVLKHEQPVHRKTPCRLSRAQKHSQLLFRMLGFRLIPHQADGTKHQIAGAIEHSHREITDEVCPAQWKCNGEYTLLGTANRQHLWRLLTNKQVQKCDHDKSEHHGNRLTSRRGPPGG